MGTIYTWTDAESKDSVESRLIDAVDTVEWVNTINFRELKLRVEEIDREIANLTAERQEIMLQVGNIQTALKVTVDFDKIDTAEIRMIR